jgi:hypothetical protein
MIHILNLKDKRSGFFDMTLDKVCLKFRGSTFIGQVGDGPDESLYLVLRNSILLLNSDTSVWSSDMCPVYIKEFVDIEVSICKKTKEI